MTWRRAIWNSFHFDWSRLERNGLHDQGSVLSEPEHDLGPQEGGRSLRKRGQFSSRRNQPEHLILSLSTHRVASHAVIGAGGPLAALAAFGKRRRQGMQERPAAVSNVRSTPSVSRKESFVQIETDFTSFVAFSLGSFALFLLMKLGFDQIGERVDRGWGVRPSCFEIEPASTLGGE